jgi:ketosteroid isomerase-like protein
MTASANLDFVQSLYAAWERGDFFSSAEWADPKIEFVIADGPDPVKWTGLAAMAEGMRDRLRNFERWRTAADEYRELDDERVLVLVRSSGRGKTSGVEVAQIQSEGANLFHLRNGRVTRLVVYWERERALADLGIAPEAGTAPSPD